MDNNTSIGSYSGDEDIQQMLEKVSAEILSSDMIVVSSHISPDGDNVGSSTGFIKAMKKLGKKVFYCLDDNIPENLEFLVDGFEKLSSQEFMDSDEYKNKSEYTFVSFDCADRGRICADDEVIKSAKLFVNVDHHFTNDLYADLNYCIREYSSTCELVFNMLTEMEKQLENSTQIIDSKVATSIYTGLLTDTGNYKYDSTSPSTLRAGATLLERGADKEKIVTTLFQSQKYSILRLLGEAIMNIEMIDSDKLVSLAVVDIEMMKKYGVGYDEIDIVTDYTRDIEGVEVGIFMKQKKEGEYKVSLRSKSFVDVSEIASSLGGGGHKRAAGFTVPGEREDCIEKVKSTVLEFLEKYK